MKRTTTILIIILAFSLCIVSSGCKSDETLYNEAVTAMENGDWDIAIEILNDLDYDNSKELLDTCIIEKANISIANGDWDEAIDLLGSVGSEEGKELLDKCIKEKGMHEKADYEFLEAIGKSVMKRYQDANSGNSKENLVNSELAALDSFRDKEFYDSELKELAEKYLECLDEQKYSLSLNQTSGEAQTTWLRGMSVRFWVLTQLTDKYGFLSEDIDYIANYYNMYKKVDDEFWRVCKIHEAIVEQLDNGNAEQVAEDMFRIVFNNTTDYDFSLTGYYTYSYKGTTVGSYTCDYDVKSGSSVNFDFQLPEYLVTSREFDQYGIDFVIHNNVPTGY